MPFLLPDQQHQSTEGTLIIAKTHKMLNLNKQKMYGNLTYTKN